MKFLAFVDLHEQKKPLQKLLARAAEKDIEFIVCAGDLSWFGRNLRYVLKQFNELGKKFYFIPGNHETNEQLQEVLKGLEYCENIHRRAVKIGNYVFFGYGEGGFSREDAEFRKLAREWYGQYKEEKTVLVTHGPPYGCKVDFIEKRHVGNLDYRKFIDRMKPRLALCGHLHETAGALDQLEKTKVLNPGWDGMVIELN